MLIEMKNTSELMVDLAYSSMIYNNKDIAEEGMYLEEKIDQTYSKIQQMAVEEAIKDGTPTNALIIIRLATSIEAISDSAARIADHVLRNVDIHPVIRESIRESDITIVRSKICKTSVLANKSLGDINLASETGMWIIAIKRGEGWLFGPTENTVLREGDILIAKGPIESVGHFQNLCRGVDKKI